jgi:biopolymer transport protein ExbD
MALSLVSDEAEEEVISAINTTPLVDVMLVLLIIFLITIPVAIQTVPIHLPKANSVVNITQPKNITIAVDAAGQYYWNASLVPSRDALMDQLVALAKMEPQPEIQVRGDEMVKFEAVGRLILDIQRAGILKVGFVTEPQLGN